ncbi:hypothetical protein BJ138DRAFT_1107087 [Hygrophoropsis aurantiaca]|uniref:Uncharacterized protein n=1 Tax=Hygrophoropsis aurantiaca TaxID=72124 RepID=A0ACB7ZTD6_9AGAM|nr:hypothetical protein BJ138DRAFT_1107087 [Hygrophoropsis aurantiaca]
MSHRPVNASTRPASVETTMQCSIHGTYEPDINKTAQVRMNQLGFGVLHRFFFNSHSFYTEAGSLNCVDPSAQRTVTHRDMHPLIVLGYCSMTSTSNSLSTRLVPNQASYPRRNDFSLANGYVMAERAVVTGHNSEFKSIHRASSLDTLKSIECSEAPSTWRWMPRLVSALIPVNRSNGLDEPLSRVRPMIGSAIDIGSRLMWGVGRSSLGTLLYHDQRLSGNRRRPLEYLPPKQIRTDDVGFHCREKLGLESRERLGTDTIAECMDNSHERNDERNNFFKSQIDKPCTPDARKKLDRSKLQIPSPNPALWCCGICSEAYKKQGPTYTYTIFYQMIDLKHAHARNHTENPLDRDARRPKAGSEGTGSRDRQGASKGRSSRFKNDYNDNDRFSMFAVL